MTGIVGGAFRTAGGILLARAIWAGGRKAWTLLAGGAGLAVGFGMNPVEKAQEGYDQALQTLSRIPQVVVSMDAAETLSLLKASPGTLWITGTAIVIGLALSRTLIGRVSWGILMAFAAAIWVNL